MKLVATIAAVAAVAFMAWQGPGLWLALRPQPPVNLASAAAVEVLDLSLAVDAARPSLRSYPVRAFVARGWREKPIVRKLPVVFYLPSWGGRPTDNDILLGRIAGDGYLVLAVADVAHDEPEPGESAEQRSSRVAPLDLYDTEGVTRLVNAGDLKADLAVRKISHLIDALEKAQVGPGSELWQLADLNRMAVIGYSFGGSSAAATLRTDPRVQAAINIDGWCFGTNAARPIAKPYLEFASTNSMPPVEFGLVRRNTWAVDRISRAREAAQLALPQSRLIAIRGTLHGDYSDGVHGADRWTQWRPWQPPLADPANVRQTIDRNVLAFLAQNVKSAMPAEMPSAAVASDRKSR